MTPRPISKILIANRGEIATRIIRTCRAMGIATVAVCSDPDRHAPFVQLADEVVPLGGSRPTESYLRGDAILDAASRSGADAIHPGYGFLSENASFAQSCADAGLIFIGPSPQAIAAMGSKIEAKRLMDQANVPILPTIEVANQSLEEIAAELAGISWPLLVKASAGGGGRGMRIVHEQSALKEALANARQEAESAFGDGTLFIEPYIESSRHIEVQIFGDTHGNVIHLFERECSIQRRHQKIIEEAPSPIVDDSTRKSLCDAAVRAGKQIGYVNAGTVEFLMTESKQFYFLEVNTRLQVEHPVTECITGLDLVRLQILVAQGHPLPGQPTAAAIDGHAIEVRLYAEDPAQDYLPAAGALHRFRVPAELSVRVDSGVAETCEVSPFYDPMLAKIIAHAPARTEAANRLATALARTQIHGVQTNRELLVRVLQHPEFIAAATDTHFLQRHDVKQLSRPLGDSQVERWHAVAATLADQAHRRATANVLRHVPSGWRNSPSQFEQAIFAGDSGEIKIEYRFDRSGLQVRIDGTDLDVTLVAATREQVTLLIDGVQRKFLIHRVGDVHYVDSVLGCTALQEKPRFPDVAADAVAGSMVAPLPGVVCEVAVKIGDQVAAGDLLVVIESMKVLHQITAPTAGRVSQLSVQAGDTIAAGAILAVIDEQTETEGTVRK
jgi:acetyl/propionyl-CoA carboxylase alpha subunit